MRGMQVQGLSILGALLLALTACGGDTPAPDGTPEPTPEPETRFPPLQCPEGAVYGEEETPNGFEQVCTDNGNRVGPYKAWHDLQIPATEGEFKNGLSDGDWLWWFPDGKKKSKGSFKSGKQTGAWTWWHQNGEPAEEGNFLDGRKVGQWTTYYASGRIQVDGLYHNGVRHGTWIHHRDDETNTIARRETWQTGNLTETKYEDAEGKEIKEPLPGDPP